MDVAAFARGYLGLIGSSNKGAGIRTASDSLAPVVELTPLLGLNERRWFQGSVVLNGGQQNIGAVPAGEVWRVIASQITVQAGAGETAAEVFVNVTVPDNAGGELLILSGKGNANAITSRAVAFHYGGLLLASGTGVNIKCDGALVGTVNATGAVLYELLRG